MKTPFVLQALASFCLSFSQSAMSQTPSPALPVFSRSLQQKEIADLKDPNCSSFITATESVGQNSNSSDAEKYKILPEADHATLFVCLKDKNKIHLEKFVFKGVVPVCELVNGGPEYIFRCMSLDLPEDSTNRSLVYEAWTGSGLKSPEFLKFGKYRVVLSAMSDYIKFNKSKLSFEKVANPVEFEKSLFINRCLNVIGESDACKDVVNAILWSELKYLDEKTGAFDKAPLSQQSLAALNTLYKKNQLANSAGPQTEILGRYKFKDQNVFLFRRKVLDDEGISTYAIVGFKSAQGLLYGHQFSGGKYTDCGPPSYKNGVITLNCGGGEGGQSWGFNLAIDLAQHSLKTIHHQSQDSE